MKKIAVIVGSKSDLSSIEPAKQYAKFFDMHLDILVMSAHRTPEKVKTFANSASENGYFALVAGAGMAAHLAGTLAAQSTLPVIGVPIDASSLNGMDALLSTVQMPAGVPVATMAIGKSGFINAIVFCAEMIAIENSIMHEKILEFRQMGAKL